VTRTAVKANKTRGAVFSERNFSFPFLSFLEIENKKIKNKNDRPCTSFCPLVTMQEHTGKREGNSGIY
jgi:hypothetical protein